MRRSTLVILWGVLLALLGVSLLFGSLGQRGLAVLIIFGVATLKAYLVAFFYMRLKWEPGYILAMILGGIGLMVILFFTLVPDIVSVYGG